MNRPDGNRFIWEESGRPADRDVVTGRNAVQEALKAGRNLDHVLVAKGERSGSIVPILALCRERGIPVKETNPRKLDQLCGPHHQGIAAVSACKEYASLDNLFLAAEKAGEPPFFVICDGIEDPHNLGAILRSAEATGVHGVIVPKRHGAGADLGGVQSVGRCGGIRAGGPGGQYHPDNQRNTKTGRMGLWPGYGR